MTLHDEECLRIKSVGKALNYFYQLDVPIDRVIEEIRIKMTEEISSRLINHGLPTAAYDSLADMCADILLARLGQYPTVVNTVQQSREEFEHHFNSLGNAILLYYTALVDGSSANEDVRNFYSFMAYWKRKADEFAR